MYNETDEHEVQVLPVNSEVVYQQDKAQLDIQISTAKAFPRNMKKAVEKALTIVTLDVPTAESCTYALQRKGKGGEVKIISGPSVHLAKILAQVWGNMRIDAKVVDIGEKEVTSEAVAFDLESNLAIKTQVKRSIWSSAKNGPGYRYSNDMIVVTGNAANSIALRNAVLSVIPKAVVNKVYNEALKKITGDVSDKTKLIARRNQIFDGLKDTYGLTEKEILYSLGKAAIDHVTELDLTTLIGFGQAIKEGDTSVDQIFRPKPEAPAAATSVDKEKERMLLMIADCKTFEELDKLKPSLNWADQDIIKTWGEKSATIEEENKNIKKGKGVEDEALKLFNDQNKKDEKK